MSDYTELNMRFENFLKEHKLEKAFRKVGDNTTDHWVYYERGYENTPFYIHNIAMSVDHLLMKVYEAAVRDGEKNAQRVAIRRLSALFDVPYDIY